jgi:hypothetical protein
VRAYGLDDIEAWLESAPVTHVWLSEELNLHPTGLVAGDSWWESWAGATSPALSPKIVLAGRDKAVEDLKSRLMGSPQVVTIKGGSLYEILAFVWGAAQADVMDGGALAARTAWVDDITTWRALRDHPEPLLLAPVEDSLTDEMAAGSHHHVVIPVLGSTDADIEIPPLDSVQVAETLKELGLEDPRNDEAARIARRSLLALRRHLAIKPELHQPSWAKPPVARNVRRLLLTGQWNEASDADREIVASVFRVSYPEVADEMTERLSDGDPLVVRTGSTLGLVSPYDAWALLRRNLDTEDLRRFEEAALTVLREPDPRLELPVEDQWRSSLLGATRSHSGDLRRGIATTLALLGGHGEATVVGSTTKGEEWAAAIVRQLLESANEDKTGHLWASLGDVLPLLSEAAPGEFLEAVRVGLRGASPLLVKMFFESSGDSFLAPTSPHVHLLWALEVCAWAPDHFGQTVEHLAYLVEIDPARNSNSGNRPFRSLDSIFCPWHPNASVKAERRLEALKGMRDRHPDVAWELMLALLPEGHDVSFPTMAPRFRDWKPQKVSALIPEYLASIDALIDGLLEDVGESGDRWVQLIKELDDLPPASRSKVVDALGGLADRGLLPEERELIWEALRSLVARHREFVDAQWALPADEVNELDQLAQRFEPQTPQKRYAWLFNEHMPEIPDVQRGGGDWDAYNDALARLRADAALEICTSDGGWQSIDGFAANVELPQFFGIALAQAGVTKHEAEMIAKLDSDDSQDLSFAYGYLDNRFRTEGWPWVEKLLENEQISPKQIARLLLTTSDIPKSWEVADLRGGDVADVFWREFRLFGLGAEFPHVELVARRLLQVGREPAALEFVRLYALHGAQKKKEDKLAYAPLIADALEQLGARAQPDPEMGLLSHHEFVDIFAFLADAKLPTDRLARLEWAYLPALGYDARPVALGRMMADDPAFFVDVVSRVYRPRAESDEDDADAASTEKTEKEELVNKDDEEKLRSLAMNAYRLLSEWRRVPGVGEDGVIEEAALRTWVQTARERLRESARLEVGDTHIGQVLAWSPPDADGVWPGEAVRNLLETLQSEDVENGLRIELYNSRGPTSRSPFAGGVQERELANKYREQATGFVDRWPQTASVLRALADTYDRDARRHDDDAERTHRGLR